MSAVLISQLLAASAASGVRGAATLLLLAVAGWAGWIELPEGMDVLGTVPAIAALATLAALEELVEGDEDLQELLEVVNYVVRGGGGALVAWTVMAGTDVGIPEAAAPVVGAALAAGAHHLRTDVHATVRGFGDSVISPRVWLMWLERGGLVGVFVAMILAPVVALAFVLLAAIGALAALVARRRMERTLFRRACPACGHLARVEARRCAGCSGALEIRRWRARGTD